ncbi:MAG: PQQ-binding-like beta-propeller repeat protein [Ardenticatenaceae bacterium]|nr:PQQ-binding-like beta-propeller repeat protein [Ardenticatenaceae bacterium]
MNRSHVPFVLFVLICLAMVTYGYFRTSSSHIAIKSNTLPLELIWTYKAENPIKLTALSTSNVIAILDEKGTVKALNSQTGALKWQYETGSKISNVSYSTPKWGIEGDRLILAPDKENLLALDAQTGEKIWQTRLSASTWNLPTISIQSDMITVGEWDTNTNGYLAGYNLQDGRLRWNVIINQPKSYRFLFKCPFIFTRSGRLENALCVLLSNDKMLIIDTRQQIENQGSGLLSTGYPPVNTLNTPVFQDGFIFTNPSLNPAIHVLDTLQEKQFMLPANCQHGTVAHPVTTYNQRVLVANGCNEVYILDIHQLDQEPEWIFQSNEEIYSSFVTVNGQTGYFLNEKAEVIGVNLATGTYVGKLTLNSNQLKTGQFINYLVVFNNNLFLAINEYHLLAFEHS